MVMIFTEDLLPPFPALLLKLYGLGDPTQRVQTVSQLVHANQRKGIIEAKILSPPVQHDSLDLKSLLESSHIPENGRLIAPGDDRLRGLVRT